VCEPTTLMAVSIGLTAAQGVASYVGQSQMASQQAKANAATARSVNESTRINLAQLGIQGQQERDAASQKAQEVQRERLKAEARARVSAGEAGVSGLSVDALLNDYSKEESRYLESLETNMDYNQQQRDLEAQGIVAQGQSRINSMPLPNTPSLLGTALQIGAGSLDAYDRYGSKAAPSRSGRVQ